MPSQTPQDLRDLQQPLIHHANDKSNGSEKLTIDEMLQKYCGEFGRWQLRHFVLTSLAWALEAFHTMVMIFADREPRWWCTGPGCQAQTQVCGLPPGSWDWVDGFGSSTVAEWGLVCGDKYKVGLVQSIFFFGCMIGAGIFGHLSDSSLGRKGSLSIICLLNGILGCLTALSPNYGVYTILRFLSGLGTGGVGMCAFVLATEPIGATKRGVAGMSTFYFFSTGIALLSGIAYTFPSWRSLYVASSIPSLLFITIVIPFLSESPRWYLVRGKTKEAMEVMRQMALTNGRTIPLGVELTLDDNAYANKTNHIETHKIDDILLQGKEAIAINGSLIDVLKSPVTRVRLYLAFMINFCCAVVYYGLSLNVVNLDTNLYLNVLLNAVAEMPAFTLTAMMLDKFGRKPLTIGTMWFSGVFCLLGIMMNKSYGMLRMICGILGIFAMAGTYNLLFIYTVELFPTVVRNAALGCVTQASQMGAILAPLVVVMPTTFPFIVFSVCAFVGGLLGFLLPETLNQPLYDTMAALEEGQAISTHIFNSS
ncbi:organic cation/carnitine transporter 4 isoform X1 [Spinacia oleracea]|uniref:Organic cation/carnitine transporter 4 isoform X1 n=1 Tax=Spinacia oleracea TaxID=3562 RepID=A0A9R0JJ04_SPIOL|nr:organic cation/carnitine transporter 4 isoform X1 [Spinacia oleracea]